MIDLSIVVVSYRDPQLLRVFLKSLSSHIPSHIRSEVIVVDSASTPETRNVVTHDASGMASTIQLIAVPENTGYTRAISDFRIFAKKGPSHRALF